MNGRVKSYSPAKGYGFITSEDIDYFIHIKDWKYQLPPAVGMKVDFVPKRTDKGFRATNVRKET